jgi:hypothetical protein
MNSPLQAALLVLVLGAVPGAAAAALLAYDERRDGDIASSSPFLPGPPDPGPLFVLGVGVNTIVGRTSYGVAAADQDFDFFRLQVPGGAALASATFDWSSFAPNGTLAGANVGPFVLAGARSLVDSASIQFLATGDGARGLWTRELPLDSGIYELAYVIGIGRDQDATGTRWAVDYAWTFVVAPQAVPAPATLGLFAAALAGLASSRRRAARARREV